MVGRGVLSAAYIIAVIGLSSGGASAQTADDRILAKLAALEARVATLETENREYKREVEQTRASARGKAETRIRESNAAIPSSATVASVYPGIPSAPTMPNWTGAY